MAGRPSPPPRHQRLPPPAAEATPSRLGILVMIWPGVRRSRKKSRFLAPVGVFGSRERDFRAGVRCSRGEAVSRAPLAWICQKRLPEPVENPCQTDPYCIARVMFNLCCQILVMLPGYEMAALKFGHIVVRFTVTP
jgi:hypothetical protein